MRLQNSQSGTVNGLLEEVRKAEDNVMKERKRATVEVRRDAVPPLYSLCPGQPAFTFLPLIETNFQYLWRTFTVLKTIIFLRLLCIANRWRAATRALPSYRCSSRRPASCWKRPPRGPGPIVQSAMCGSCSWRARSSVQRVPQVGANDVLISALDHHQYCASLAFPSACAKG